MFSIGSTRLAINAARYNAELKLWPHALSEALVADAHLVDTRHWLAYATAGSLGRVLESMKPRRAATAVPEVALLGGHQSQPVRVGKTVRRATGPWSPSIHAVLRHLEAAGFSGAPRFIGLDDKGREVLSYVEGRAASGTALPAYVWSDLTLIDVARLLHQLHVATESFQPPPEAVWRQLPGAPDCDEVICHNDAAPWNTVFRRRRPVTFIDWESAAPGPRIWDVAYVAWHWVPLWADERCLSHGFSRLRERPRRLRVLCNAYGLHDRSTVLETVRLRQQAWLKLLSQQATAGDPASVRLAGAGAERGVAADALMLERDLNSFKAVLQ